VIEDYNSECWTAASGRSHSVKPRPSPSLSSLRIMHYHQRVLQPPRTSTFFTTPEPHNTQPPTPLVEFHSYSRDMTPQVIRNQRTATYLHTACCRSGSPAYRTHTSLLAKHAEKIRCRILGRRDAARSCGRAALPIYMSIALNSANVIWDLSTNPRTFCLTARAVHRACFRMSRHTQNTAGRHRYKEAFLSDVAD
jgi:hypothetical protein